MKTKKQQNPSRTIPQLDRSLTTVKSHKITEKNNLSLSNHRVNVIGVDKMSRRPRKIAKLRLQNHMFNH